MQAEALEAAKAEGKDTGADLVLYKRMAQVRRAAAPACWCCVQCSTAPLGGQAGRAVRPAVDACGAMMQCISRLSGLPLCYCLPTDCVRPAPPCPPCPRPPQVKRLERMLAIEDLMYICILEKFQVRRGLRLSRLSQHNMW